MITLITYDITEPYRLNKLREFLKDFGLRTQKSVFECEIDGEGLRMIRKYCKNHLDLATDSVRIYRICTRCLKKVIITGQGIKVKQLDYMII